MPESPNRQRLAELMEGRRKDLRLRWQDVAEASGLSLKTLHSVRSSDKRVAELTKTGIEDGLRWEHGSVDLILSGGDPVPLPAAEAAFPLSPAADDFDVMQVIPVPAELRDAARPYAVKYHRLYVEAVARTGSTDPPGDEVFEPHSWGAQSWDLFRRQFPDTLRRLGIIAGASVPDDRAPGRQHGTAAGLTAQAVSVRAGSEGGAA